MNLFRFQCNGFSGCVQGINGRLVQNTNKEEPIDESCTLEVGVHDNTFCSLSQKRHSKKQKIGGTQISSINGRIMENTKKEEPIAESCTLEVVHDNTFKTWKQCIKKENLDGVILKNIPNLVSTIEKAVSSETPAISLSLVEVSNGNLSMVLSIPGLFGPIATEFCLEAIEQDEISILKQRVDLQEESMKRNENKMQQQFELLQKTLEKREESQQEELKKNEKMQQQLQLMQQTMQQQQLELLEKMKQQQEESLEKMTKQEESLEKMKQQQEESIQKMTKQYEELLEKKKKEDKTVDKTLAEVRKFVDCGDLLSISACGMLVVHKGSSNGWRSATVGEKMSDGVYFAQFMYFKVSSNSDYRCLCGVLPTTSRNLNDYIYNNDGGFCFYTYDGNAWKGNGSISTGLSSCNESSGPLVIGVLLNLDKKQIQFVVDGIESKTLDIEDGEYTFAVSLAYQFDAVKLLSIEQQS